MSQPTYATSNPLQQLATALNSGLININSQNQVVQVSSNLVFSNSSLLFTVIRGALIPPSIAGSPYTVNSPYTVIQTIQSVYDTLNTSSSGSTGSSGSSGSSGSKTNAPKVYIGDYMTVDSTTNVVDFANARLKTIADAVNPTDVPSYQQLTSGIGTVNATINATNTDLNTQKGRIDAILDGASITNFKALKDFIDSVDGVNDGELGTAITNLTGQIGDEKTRAKQAESDLSGNVHDEFTRASCAEGVLQTNIDAENLRASNAESSLSTSITTEVSRALSQENILKQKQITSISLLPSAAVLGGQSFPQAVPPTYYVPFDGWYYTNKEPSSGTNNKFSWAISVPANTKFKDIQYMSFNTCIYSNASLPFITFYSLPKVGGATSWYGAKQAYEILNPSSIKVNSVALDSSYNATPYQLYARFAATNNDALVSYGYQQVQMSLSNVVSSNVGTMSPDDIIYSIVISSNSHATQYQVDCLINSGFVTTPSGTFESTFSNDYISNSNLTATVNTLSTTLSGNYSDLQTKLNAQITLEASDKKAVTDYADTLNGQQTSAIGQEISDRKSAIDVLQGKINTINTTITQANSDVTGAIISLNTKDNQHDSKILALQQTFDNLNKFLFSANTIPSATSGTALTYNYTHV